MCPQVLIPIAAQTSAVVICSAIPNLCILSAAFTRMYKATAAKWQGKPPFTIISSTSDMIGARDDDAPPPVEEPPGTFVPW